MSRRPTFSARGPLSPIVVSRAAWLAVLASAVPARGADVVQNGSFVAEDFATAAAWQAVDDKFGTIHQASDFSPWSDEAPNYGAILRICQDADEVSGASGGVWGAHIEQTVPLVAGRTYDLSFWAAELAINQLDPSCALHGTPSHALQVQVYGESSGELLSAAIDVASCGTTCGSTHELSFVAPQNESASIKFFFGGQWAKLKLSGVALNDSAPPSTAGDVSINQVGYGTAAPKRATLRATAASALPWELRGEGGVVLASGTTLPFGADALSGDNIHRVDFSAFAGGGDDLHLSVDGALSEPFDVRGDVHARLARDSLRFFYYQRCGQGLALPHAEAEALVRGVDHTGDSAASCSAGQSCNVGYPLDVSGGWHDAGDYGKYVVSGSIAVWTLLDAYERAMSWGTRLAQLGDGQLNTGAANGVPDILDEARHELGFLLGMQVPEGNPLAGMAHHKYHSEDWVPMPTRPESDSSERFLHPPSTTATLGLAATAAQCGRVWRDIDAAFAERCRTAAERAWAAALAHPGVYAPSSSNVGGGPYDDGYAGDELYWAAAELFVTTGGSEYGDHLRASSHFASFNTGTIGGPFSWPSTAGLGTISLALVPSALDAIEVDALRRALVEAAEVYVSLADQSGYRAPLGGAIWGSNADVLNAGILFALAHDLSGDLRFEAAATSALDYVLGNNPHDRSFVTGYGSRPVTQIHHTLFAPYLSASFPEPPPGFIVGGPNADLEAFADPGVAADCSPLRCWSETSGAYWFIEVAVNWNAPLAWLSHWLDERAQAPRTSPVGVGDTATGGAASDAGAGGSGTSGGGGATSGNPSLSDPNRLDSNGPDGIGAPKVTAGCACRMRGDGTPADALASLLLVAMAWLRRTARR